MKDRNINRIIVISICLIVIALYFLRSYNLIYKPIYGVIYNKETNSVWRLRLIPNTALINKWEPFYSIKIDLKCYSIIENIEYLGQSSESNDSLLKIIPPFNPDIFQDTLKRKIVFKGQFYEVPDTIDDNYFSGSWKYYKNLLGNNSDIVLTNLILQSTIVNHTNWKFQFIINKPLFLNNCLLIRGDSYYDVPDIRYPVF